MKLEALRMLVRELVVLVVLVLFLELLLPAGDMRRYVRMVFGLLVIAAVVQAATRPWLDLAQDFSALSVQTVPAVSEGMDEGRRLWERNQERARMGYQDGIAKQVRALAAFNPYLEICDVKVRLADGPQAETGALAEVVITVTEKERCVDRVQVKDGLPEETGGGDTVDEMARLQAIIAGFYNLLPEQVTVIRS